jgi:hypothetical protein
MIFNGIEIMFYLLGFLTAVGVYIMIYYAKKYILKWGPWLLGVLAIIFSLFTIAWSWSSILEKEPQAAGLGLLIFGIPALILLFITRRMVLKSEEK